MLEKLQYDYRPQEGKRKSTKVETLRFEDSPNPLKNTTYHDTE